MAGRVRTSLPVVSLERRRQMLELPGDAETHAALLAELVQLDDVEASRPDPPRADPVESVRVAGWNLERGRHEHAAARLLEATGANAFLLSELDQGMARSGQRDTARDLAARLHCGHVYGVEFLELGLGDQRERETHAGEQNRVGYHGGAILSPHLLHRPRLVRLERSGRWFDGERGERRVGGRIAVLATLRLAGVDVTLASVHLESHADPEQRAAEMRVLLDAIDAYGAGGPALIGGDVNASSLGMSHLRDRDRLARALHDDPDRLMNPVPHEPLFALAAGAGYDWKRCNRLDLSTQRKRAPSARGRLRLDWFFSRGLIANDPEVIAAVDPDTGSPLSDHEVIAVSLRPET